MKIKRDWGLVLAGGGGKGAYQIGAWKALLERKQLRISAVSGTSVGALNAALFSAGSLEKAEEIWGKQIDQEVVLTPDFFRSEEAIHKLQEVMREYRDWLTEWPLSTSVGWFIRKMIRRGVFSREGLDRIIRENDILPKVLKSDVDCYATCYNLKKQSAEYFLLQKYREQDMLDILLASSALPLIFPPQEIHGQKYWDGGLKDNVPIRPLYEAGYRKMLIIHLDQDDSDLFSQTSKKAQKKNLLVDQETQMHYPDATLIHFHPQKTLSGLLGTLDFHPRTIRRKMKQGYTETKKRLEQLSQVP